MDIGFAAGTKVLTKKGQKNIESVTTRDEVLTANGTYRKVSQKMADKSDDIYELKILFQPDTKVTGNQRYCIRRKMEDGYSLSRWVPVNDINVGDLAVIYMLDDTAPVHRPIKSIKKMDETHKVYSLKTNEKHSFTANGAVVDD